MSQRTELHGERILYTGRIPKRDFETTLEHYGTIAAPLIRMQQTIHVLQILYSIKLD